MRMMVVGEPDDVVDGHGWSVPFHHSGLPHCLAESSTARLAEQHLLAPRVVDHPQLEVDAVGSGRRLMLQPNLMPDEERICHVETSWLLKAAGRGRVTSSRHTEPPEETRWAEARVAALSPIPTCQPFNR
jgi:hypothetical protein